MNKLTIFLRKNALYIVVALCIMAIGLSVALVLIKNSNSKISTVSTKKDNTEVQQETDEPIETEIIFSVPIESYSKVSEYSLVPVFNKTLNRYESHKAIDFFADSETKVLAVYGGTVESVTNDLLTGYTVVIDHGDGLKSVYNSLSEDVVVSVGAKVKKGDVLGEVSLSNRQEYKEGAHLHFEVEKDGVIINPEEYLITEYK